MRAWLEKATHPPQWDGLEGDKTKQEWNSGYAKLTEAQGCGPSASQGPGSVSEFAELGVISCSGPGLGR